MGSIIHINRNPSTWVIIDEGYVLTKAYGGESIVKIRYGSFCDDPDGLVDMEMYMRKHIYTGLISGKYKIAKEYRLTLRILDENNNVIEPINDYVY